MAESPSFTMGIEEEYQIVDPVTRELKQHARSVVSSAQETVGEDVQAELYQSQIEIGTPVCHSLGEARHEIGRLRREVLEAAEREGGSVAAAGTHPFSHWQEQELTPKNRYRRLTEDHQQLAREQIIFGCHIHIGLPSREVAIQTMNRARLWLSPLLALTANSPFWLGDDSGFASFGREMWRRWPMAGIPPPFASESEYDDHIEHLLAIKAIKDPTKIYWDLRPSMRYDTLEFRVTDVCMTVDEAVMLAGLVRALARTCHGQWERGDPMGGVPMDVLAYANWCASRYGLDEELVDIESKGTIPARTMVQRLLSFVREALEADDAWDEVSRLTDKVLADGTGAARQRAAFSRSERMADVVDAIVQETRKGLG
ncbi:glutamate--cysteine ligase [soil metagenome]